MSCVSKICEEFIPVVRRMLQSDPVVDTTNTTTTNTTTTPQTPPTPPTTNTNTTVVVPEPEPYDPVSALNYSCFMCAQNSFAFDSRGCFNQSLLTKRFTAKSITTHKGCFSNGYWIKTNNQFISIPDTSLLNENTTGLWNYSYQCNKTNDEFYLHITNKMSQVNSINAGLSSLAGAGVVDGFLSTYCNGARNKECSVNASTRGFTNYTSKPGEMIELYLHCAGAVSLNTTLTVTAKYLYSIEVEEEE